MLIRYHILYYAIGCICVVLAKYVHPLFYFFLFAYLYWLKRRFDIRYVFIALACVIALWLRPINLIEMPSRIQGTVIKTNETYCYVKTDFGIVKLLHQQDFEYGDTLDVAVVASEMYENSNDYAFNEKQYLYSQKIFYKATLIQVYHRQSHTSLYHWIKRRLSSNSTVRDYQQLFLLGEKSSDIQEDYQQLSQLSLVHLFALSGMHLHILKWLLKSVFGLIFKQRTSQWITYLCIGIYVFSIPMQISLYRAFFMMILMACLHHWLNEYDVFSILVIVSLFYNPYIIFNISFIFSYFIYFIVLLTKKMKYSSFWIYISGIPIVLSLNSQIPFFSFLVGIVMTPFIEFFYAICCLSVIFQFLEPILRVCIYIFDVLLNFLSHISIFFIFSKPTLLFIFLFYLLFFWILFSLDLKKKIQMPISIMIALFISFSFYSQYKIYGEVTMIDVGQGDCTLIRLPMNQGNVLIDTGGVENVDLAQTTIIPYLKAIGIQHLDYVYISHDDYDHCGALESLMEHFDVRHVIREYEEYREIGCMKVTMLQTDHFYSDSNDQSLMMYVELPAMKLLFMGDASKEVERDLQQKYGFLDVGVLKVSHHGSASSSSPALFEMIQPKIAMIGVKKNNLYHHPAQEVIERLQRKQITILRTDEDGMFHLRFYGKERYIFR